MARAPTPSAPAAGAKASAAPGGPAAAQGGGGPDGGEHKTVASLLREAVAQAGYKDVKECARSIRVPYDLFNKVLGGHLPKDAQLADYARRLGLDERELLLAAYREKAPDAVKPCFNAVVLLEQQPAELRELLDLLDTSTPAQRAELLEVARLLHGQPRERCTRALALLRLYHALDDELAGHFHALVQMALRHEPLPALEDFRQAVGLPPDRAARPASRSTAGRRTAAPKSPRSGGGKR